MADTKKQLKYGEEVVLRGVVQSVHGTEVTIIPALPGPELPAVTLLSSFLDRRPS